MNDDDTKAVLINIDVNVETDAETGEQCYLVTSPELPQICLVHSDPEFINKALEDVIVGIYRDKGEEVSAHPLLSARDFTHRLNSPWVALHRREAA